MSTQPFFSRPQQIIHILELLFQGQLLRWQMQSSPSSANLRFVPDDTPVPSDGVTLLSPHTHHALAHRIESSTTTQFLCSRKPASPDVGGVPLPYKVFHTTDAQAADALSGRLIPSTSQAGAPYPHPGAGSDATEAEAGLLLPPLHEISVTWDLGDFTPPLSRDVAARHPVLLYNGSRTNVTPRTRDATSPSSSLERDPRALHGHPASPEHSLRGHRRSRPNPHHPKIAPSDDHSWHLTRKTPDLARSSRHTGSRAFRNAHRSAVPRPQSPPEPLRFSHGLSRPSLITPPPNVTFPRRAATCILLRIATDILRPGGASYSKRV